MLNARVPAAGEAMPAAIISPTIAGVIAAHRAAQSANGEAHTAHEMRPDDIAEAVAAALSDAAEACHKAERAAWSAFLDATCLSAIDVQAKLSHAFGKDGSFDEDIENARLLRSLVLPAAPPTQNAGTNYLADALNGGSAYGPSLAEQIQMHRGRSVFHDENGRPLNPAPKSRAPIPGPVLDLEAPIFDAAQAAHLASHVVHEAMAGEVPDANDRISIGRNERNLILFAVSQARAAAERADAAFSALDMEAGQ